MHTVPLSALLMILGGALGLTSTPWSKIWDRRSVTQIYRDIKSGKDRSGLYTRVVGLVALAIMVAGIYLAVTGR